MSGYKRIVLTKHVFDEVRVTGVKKWKDPVTGRPRQQTRVFAQTVNPFNKNAQGQVKTREEIKDELRSERDAWLAEGAPDA